MIRVREATHDDNDALLALARAAPMAGSVALAIERAPDFFRLQRLRGEGTILVATSGDRVVGCVSAAFRDVYVDGAPQRIAYSGDLKVHPAFSGSRAALRLILGVTEVIKSNRVGLVFIQVAAENARALSVLTRGKLGTPKFESAGRFLVHEVVPSCWPRLGHGYVVAEATENDLCELYNLWQEFHRPYQLCPVTTRDAFRTLLFGDAYGTAGRVLTARRDGTLVAMLAASDMGSVKQNVIMGMPRALDAGLAILRAVGRVLPLPALPRVGEPLRALYARHLACRPGGGPALALLLHQVRRAAFRNRYSFVTVAVHERDPLRSLVGRLPKYTYQSLGLLADLGAGPATIASIQAGIPMEDFALV